MIGLVLTFFPVIVQVIANGIVRAHGDEPMSLVVTGPTSFPVTTSDSWAEDNIGEVEEAKESVLERRCIYSMHTVRSRRQAANIFAGSAFDETHSCMRGRRRATSSKRYTSGRSSR